MGRTFKVSENVWLFLILKFTPIECDVELQSDVELLGAPRAGFRNAYTIGTGTPARQATMELQSPLKSIVPLSKTHQKVHKHG